MMPAREADLAYHRWLAQHLNLNVAIEDTTPVEVAPAIAATKSKGTAVASLVPGTLLAIATQIFQLDDARKRTDGGPRARGTIDPLVAADRKSQLNHFLEFMQERYGKGSLSRI